MGNPVHAGRSQRCAYHVLVLRVIATRDHNRHKLDCVWTIHGRQRDNAACLIELPVLSVQSDPDAPVQRLMVIEEGPSADNREVLAAVSVEISDRY